MKTEKVIDYIIHWLNAYCEKSGMKGFVVGVSGGIDSAVTSTLCAKTGKPVMALNMHIYPNPAYVDLAQDHIRWLESCFPRVTGVTLDLTASFQDMEKTLPSEIQDPLTMANTRSRLRMLTLYGFAGHHRLLVAGTGNKVEDFGVGFFTKYGDGGVDLSPIADLMKSEVYELARHLGIIDGILRAKPTDGLFDDSRSDEDQIGASYDELEWAMKFDEGSTDESALDRRQREVLAIYRSFHRANRHKMDPIPTAVIPEELKTG
ncbi:MAG: NAD(+) synthase [Desulfobacterales bacterium CG23_combo_of_CG06-09_8_20_14_all_51_8]|nr:MAG: NAD(+) synthase [Desulfobacterales bacterium CG23_combo_of_CG06-09_8_20_14_all_51_8]